MSGKSFSLTSKGQPMKTVKPNTAKATMHILNEIKQKVVVLRAMGMTNEQIVNTIITKCL